MTGEFDDRDVVITGATGGLGTAVVDVFLQRGATCHLPMIETDVPAHVTWSGHERARITTGVDVADDAAVTSYYAGLPPIWASIHLAGGFAMARIADTSLGDVLAMFRINAQTCFLCSREATRSMRAGGQGGRIVNVSARPAVQPVASLAAYSMSKAAVANLTQTLAAELVGEGIGVNAVVPSIIDTPANREAMPRADFDAWPKPDELAEVIAFLASPRTTATSGSLVPVYGRA